MRKGTKIKMSKNGLTVKTRRFTARESYPGDNTVQIQVLNERGNRVVVFNIWPTTCKGLRWWDNDRYGAGPFRTITDWKKWALERAIKERIMACALGMEKKARG
jgi:hypothetical protein